MKLSQTSLTGLTFRVTSPRYSDLHRTAAMSRTHPGRFNTRLVGAVYVSREPETAVEELRRRAERDGVSLSEMHPRAIFVIDLHLHEVVDLTVPGQLDVWGLAPHDLASEEMERCQDVAGVAARLGAEAIRWASATGTGQNFAVFVENLQPGSHAEIVKSVDLSRETLAAIQDGVPAATTLSELSEFPLIA